MNESPSDVGLTATPQDPIGLQGGATHGFLEIVLGNSESSWPHVFISSALGFQAWFLEVLVQWKGLQ